MFKITFQQLSFKFKIIFLKVGNQILRFVQNQIHPPSKEMLNKIEASSSSRWWARSVFLSEQQSERGSGRMQSDGGIGSGADDWFYWLEN